MYDIICHRVIRIFTIINIVLKFVIINIYIL